MSNSVLIHILIHIFSFVPGHSSNDRNRVALCVPEHDEKKTLRKSVHNKWISKTLNVGFGVQLSFRLDSPPSGWVYSRLSAYLECRLCVHCRTCKRPLSTDCNEYSAVIRNILANQLWLLIQWIAAALKPLLGLGNDRPERSKTVEWW